MKQTLGHNLVQLFIAFDQLVGVLLTLIFFGTAWADETMSARSWRAWKDGRRWAQILMPFIDWLFSWQAPDPLILDDGGQMILRHCERAFYKEKQRRNSPPDERNTDAQRTAP